MNKYKRKKNKIKKSEGGQPPFHALFDEVDVFESNIFFNFLLT